MIPVIDQEVAALEALELDKKVSHTRFTKTSKLNCKTFLQQYEWPVEKKSILPQSKIIEGLKVCCVIPTTCAVLRRLCYQA